MAKQPVKRPSNSGKADTAIVLPRTLVKGVQTIDPSTGRGKSTVLGDSSASTLNSSINTVRTQANIYEALRLLRRLSGDTGTAIAAFVRLANTFKGFKVYDMAHQLSDEGSGLVKTIMANMEYLADATYGFDDRPSFMGVVDTLIGECMLTGACASELVLDDAQFPFRIQPVSPSKLKWKVSTVSTGANTQKIVPIQQAQGVEIELDIATFFYAELDDDPTTVYPKPAIEAAVNASIFHMETVEDIRRVVRRSGHSRLILKLITETLVKAAPIEVRMDPVKLKDYLETTRSELETQLANISPEAALVLFDSVEADYLNSEIGASSDYGPLMELVDGIESTALRTPPSVLGKRMGGSQNVSSTESLIFIKHAAGLQTPVGTVLSRLMTLAMRLYGFEGYAVAQFGPIDLRPDSELEAFKTMRQTRIMELLSYGFYTDQEAAEELGTGPRAPGAPPLSGTMFTTQKSGLDPTGMDAASATSGDPGARGASGNPAPKKGGGKSK